MGVLPVIQMVLALAIVIAAVKWLMPLALKKFGKRWTSPSGAAIKIEESAAIGPAHVFVVTVRGKTMLLGATAESVTCLADLTAPQKPEEATFRELLERAEQVPSDFDEAPSNSEATESPLSDLAQQLDRLRKLGL
jgi:flagellar biogenesis protein FliO